MRVCVRGLFVAAVPRFAAKNAVRGGLGPLQPAVDCLSWPLSDSNHPRPRLARVGAGGGRPSALAPSTRETGRAGGLEPFEAWSKSMRRRLLKTA